MIILPLLVIPSYVLALGFLLTSLACGLYYMAELVEEYSVLAKKIIYYVTLLSLILHVLLLVDGFPLLRMAFSTGCQLWYSQLYPDFPVIQFSSPVFILTVALSIVDHFQWFAYFIANPVHFSSLLTFFFFVVWMVPILYFISLSANDATLPTASSSPSRLAEIRLPAATGASTSMIKTWGVSLSAWKAALLGPSATRKKF